MSPDPRDDHLGVLLTAYADGSLHEDGCAFIEKLLEERPELRDRLGELRAAQETLRASLPAAPSALGEAQRAAVLAAARQRPLRRKWPWRALVTVAAACLVVAMVAALATPNLLESRVSAEAARRQALERQYGGQMASRPAPAAAAPDPRWAMADRGLNSSLVPAEQGKAKELDGLFKGTAIGGASLPAAPPVPGSTMTPTNAPGAFAGLPSTNGYLADKKTDSLRQVPREISKLTAMDLVDQEETRVNGTKALAKDGDLAGKQAIALDAQTENEVAAAPRGREEAVTTSDLGGTASFRSIGAGGGKRTIQPAKPARPVVTPPPMASAPAASREPVIKQHRLADKAEQQLAQAVAGEPRYTFSRDTSVIRKGGRDDQVMAHMEVEQLQSQGPIALAYAPTAQRDLLDLLGGDRARVMRLQEAPANASLAQGLLDLLPLSDGDEAGRVAVPFNLLVDPNLRVRPVAHLAAVSPGVAVLNLCTANGLQVVPAPGAFEVQAARRPLDPTATFGWNRDDLRTAFGSAPMQATAENAVQTFAIDASTSSFDSARAALDAGRLPDPAQIEPQHLYNAVPADYPAPSGDDAFALLAEAGPSPFASGPLAARTALVAVGVVSRRAAPDERLPLDLVVALDASGSMGRPGGLARARAGLAALLPQLDARDRVAVVAFGDVARVVQPAVAGDQHQALASALDGIRAEGSTNLADGLALACQVAGELATPGRACRVLLATDGAALAGEAAPAAEAAVARWRGRGVSLLVVGCADEAYDGSALERLAQRGDGEHVVAASDEAARQLFATRLMPAHLAILARDAKAQVTWNPERVAHARLIGFERRRLTAQQFRDNTVDAGELAQDAQATALFEVVLSDRGVGPLGTAAVRYLDTRLGRVVELARPLPGGLIAATASPRLRLLACAAQLGETMQCGWWRNVRGPDDGRLALELSRLDAPFARVLERMDRRFRDLEQQGAP